MEFQVPAALEAEHRELRSELDRAISKGGKLGDSANAVARMLYPHLQKEEEFALPPLSILPLLTEGQVTAEMGASLPLTNKLRCELSHLLEDHRAINAELQELARVAQEEQKWDYACYAEKFRSIAQYEEQVLYPTVLLIGRYVRVNIDE
jgi:hypothetical protein